jgi:hypothetical protein
VRSGFVAGIAVAAGLAFAPEKPILDLVSAVLGWCAMGFCHRALIIGPAGEKISFMKAMVLVIIQLIGILAFGVAVIFVIKSLRAT